MNNSYTEIVAVLSTFGCFGCCYIVTAIAPFVALAIAIYVGIELAQ